MNEWMNEQMNELINGWKTRQTKWLIILSINLLTNQLTHETSECTTSPDLQNQISRRNLHEKNPAN